MVKFVPQRWVITVQLTVEGNEVTMATRRDDLKTQVTAYKAGKADIKAAKLIVESQGFQPETYEL